MGGVEFRAQGCVVAAPPSEECAGHGGARLRADARGRDGGIREVVAPGLGLWITDGCRQADCMDKDYLSLKRVPTGASVEDYDVLCGGAVVGRIFLSQAGKWTWAVQRS